MTELIKMQPGIYPGLDFEVYKKIDAFNQSGLLDIFDCPARYWYNKNNQKDTDAMRFGRMLHTAVLEQHLFDERYIVMPDFTIGIVNPKDGLPYKAPKLSGEYQAKKKLFEAQNTDKEVVSIEQYSDMIQLQKSLILKPETNWIFEQKLQQRELTLVWEDASTGLMCKARIDIALFRTSSYSQAYYLADVKKTISSNEFKFISSVEKFGYHIQAAHYMAGAEALGMLEDEADFIHVTFEQEAPHLIGCFKIGKSALEAGRQELRKGMEIYKRCKEANEWPGYPDGIKDIDFGKEALQRSANRVSYN